MTPDQRARLRELERRVEDFHALQLPGQPMSMHMGTSYLVGDLLNALRDALDAEPEEAQSCKHRSAYHRSFCKQCDVEVAASGTDGGSWVALPSAQPAPPEPHPDTRRKLWLVRSHVLGPRALLGFESSRVGDRKAIVIVGDTTFYGDTMDEAIDTAMEADDAEG